MKKKSKLKKGIILLGKKDCDLTNLARIIAGNNASQIVDLGQTPKPKNHKFYVELNSELRFSVGYNTDVLIIKCPIEMFSVYEFVGYVRSGIIVEKQCLKAKHIKPKIILILNEVKRSIIEDYTQVLTVFDIIELKSDRIADIKYSFQSSFNSNSSNA